MPAKFSKLLRPVSLAFLVVVLVFTSYSIGYGVRGRRPRVAPTVATSQLTASHSELGVAYPSDRPEQDEEFRVFWEVWDLVERDFYGPLPEEKDRVYSAIRGLLSSLDDEHTAFLTPEQTAMIGADDSGSFEGIGASIRHDTTIGRPRIIEVFEGQPAAEAGLLAGDVVLAVDGTSTTGMSVVETIALIRGPEGSAVRLTIQREDEDHTQPFGVSVVRESIDIPTIEAEILEENVAYLRLTTFNAAAADRLKEALDGLLKHDPRGLILDLRGNPGGLLHVAVEIGSQFVPTGIIASERTRNGQGDAHEVVRGGLATDDTLPLVVLVDEGTASAAEIVAAAIQESERGILLGERTFGKISVQIPHGLSDGSELRVTTARWFTPAGNAINEGLAPTIEVERTSEDIATGNDPQMERALEHILSGQ